MPNCLSTPAGGSRLLRSGRLRFPWRADNGSYPATDYSRRLDDPEGLDDLGANDNGGRSGNADDDPDRARNPEPLLS